MKHLKRLSLALAVLMLLTALSGCGSTSSGTQTEEKAAPAASAEPHPLKVLVPEAPGSECSAGEDYSIDYSNRSQGYVMVRYSGSAVKAKVQITTPKGMTCTYTLAPSEAYAAFPLQDGSGSYTVNVLENAYDDYYAVLDSQNIDVTLADEFLPFLYPNLYVSFAEGSGTVELAEELAASAGGDLGYLTEVYHYVIRNIKYDTQKAENIPADYIPDLDETIATGKGICFDYASLMAGLLRSGGIPTKLVFGYSGSAYHAWISVYITELGWLDKVIEFDGQGWKLLDPTYAAANSEKAVKKYVGDGSSYTVKYYY